jgi:multicomponent Na+:H+ antiporter subunit C
VDTEDLKVAEQPSFDAEDDAELLEETSEFLDEHEDPNADYEHATAINPATGSLPVRLQRDGTVRVRPQGVRQERSTRGGRRAAQEPEEGENPVGYRGHDDHLPDEDERAGSPRARPPRFPEPQRNDRKQDKRDDGPGARGRRRKGEG